MQTACRSDSSGAPSLWRCFWQASGSPNPPRGGRRRSWGAASGAPSLGARAALSSPPLSFWRWSCRVLIIQGCGVRTGAVGGAVGPCQRRRGLLHAQRSQRCQGGGLLVEKLAAVLAQRLCLGRYRRAAKSSVKVRMRYRKHRDPRRNPRRNTRRRRSRAAAVAAVRAVVSRWGQARLHMQDLAGAGTLRRWQSRGMRACTPANRRSRW